MEAPPTLNPTTSLFPECVYEMVPALNPIASRSEALISRLSVVIVGLTATGPSVNLIPIEKPGT